jgi:hypothetical protein
MPLNITDQSSPVIIGLGVERNIFVCRKLERHMSTQTTDRKTGKNQGWKVLAEYFMLIFIAPMIPIVLFEPSRSTAIIALAGSAFGAYAFGQWREVLGWKKGYEAGKGEARGGSED